MLLVLGLPRAIAVALISQTNLRSSFSVLQVLPYIINFCKYCAWTWQKSQIRSDRPLSSSNSNPLNPSAQCPVLFYYHVELPSRNHDKPADRWPDTKMIANFSHVTARYNCKDQQSEIWRCNAVWEFNTLPLSTWPNPPQFGNALANICSLELQIFPNI